MSDVLVPLALLTGTIVVGLCCCLGWCADTRDPTHGLGGVLGRRRRQPADAPQSATGVRGSAE